MEMARATKGMFTVRLHGAVPLKEANHPLSLGPDNLAIEDDLCSEWNGLR
jgi:hypothetical protein